MRRLVLLFAMTVPAVAWGHVASVTYGTVDVSDDGKVAWSLKISTRDLYEALALEKDRDATDAEVEAGGARLVQYVWRRVQLTADGAACPRSGASVSILTQAQRFVDVRWTEACSLPLHKLVISYNLFFDLDPRHTGMFVLGHRDHTFDAEMTAGMAKVEWPIELRSGERQGAPATLWLGMVRLYTGAPHLALGVALLLAAATRPRRESGRVIAAFAAGATLALLAAGLGLISLPVRFVASAVAATIVYVAVENLAIREPRGRIVTAAIAGLPHGVAFAAALAPDLPAAATVPLLVAAAGLLLALASVAAPLALLLHQAGRARRPLLLVGSTLAGLLGLYWLIEQTFGKLLG